MSMRMATCTTFVMLDCLSLEPQILAYAIYSLYSALRRSDMKSRVSGLMGFLCLGFVGIVVIGLAMQLWGRKC